MEFFAAIVNNKGRPIGLPYLLLHNEANDSTVPPLYTSYLCSSYDEPQYIHDACRPRQ